MVDVVTLDCLEIYRLVLASFGKIPSKHRESAFFFLLATRASRRCSF